MSESLMRLPAVVAKTGLSRSALYMKVADGEFPKPVHIGKRAVAWPESVIQNWIRERIAQHAQAA